MIKYFQTLLSVFVLCTLCCKSGYAGVDQIQVQAVDALTAEFVKSGGDSAKPVTENIKKHFDNSDRNFAEYSDIPFKGNEGFTHGPKKADSEQKTVQNTTWDKAVINSAQTMQGSQTSGGSRMNNRQTECKKYGKTSECKKTGAGR